MFLYKLLSASFKLFHIYYLNRWHRFPPGQNAFVSRLDKLPWQYLVRHAVLAMVWNCVFFLSSCGDILNQIFHTIGKHVYRLQKLEEIKDKVEFFGK